MNEDIIETQGIVFKKVKRIGDIPTKLQAHIINRAIEDMTPAMQKYTIDYFNGMDNVDIARKYGVNRTTVWRVVESAKKKIEKAFDYVYIMEVEV